MADLLDVAQAVAFYAGNREISIALGDSVSAFLPGLICVGVRVHVVEHQSQEAASAGILPNPALSIVDEFIAGTVIRRVLLNPGIAACHREMRQLAVLITVGREGLHIALIIILGPVSKPEDTLCLAVKLVSVLDDIGSVFEELGTSEIVHGSADDSVGNRTLNIGPFPFRALTVLESALEGGESASSAVLDFALHDYCSLSGVIVFIYFRSSGLDTGYHNLGRTVFFVPENKFRDTDIVAVYAAVGFVNRVGIEYHPVGSVHLGAFEFPVQNLPFRISLEGVSACHPRTGEIAGGIHLTSCLRSGSTDFKGCTLGGPSAHGSLDPGEFRTRDCGEFEEISLFGSNAETLGSVRRSTGACPIMELVSAFFFSQFKIGIHSAFLGSAPTGAERTVSRSERPQVADAAAW